MNILLTGFEAFDQSKINPSMEIVKIISQEADLIHPIYPLILPVDTNQAPKIICQAIDTINPDVILSLGEASNHPAISIERIAVNIMDFRIADNNGNKVEDQPVNPFGPAAYFATIPVKLIYQNLRNQGIPAERSLTAGTYLCNQIFYTVLDKNDQDKTGRKAGFIHVPSLPQQVVEKDKLFPSMALETSVHAIKIALKTILNQS